MGENSHFEQNSSVVLAPLFRNDSLPWLESWGNGRILVATCHVSQAQTRAAPELLRLYWIVLAQLCQRTNKPLSVWFRPVDREPSSSSVPSSSPLRVHFFQKGSGKEESLLFSPIQQKLAFRTQNAVLFPQIIG